jgi:hypothetical protein
MCGIEGLSAARYRYQRCVPTVRLKADATYIPNTSNAANTSYVTNTRTTQATDVADVLDVSDVRSVRL